MHRVGRRPASVVITVGRQRALNELVEARARMRERHAARGRPGVPAQREEERRIRVVLTGHLEIEVECAAIQLAFVRRGIELFDAKVDADGR